MNRSLIRRIAVSLIALFLFAQGSVALAACAMERGAMAAAAPVEMEGDCGMMQAEASPSTGCVAHCTTDLQLSGLPLALVRDASRIHVLVVETAEPQYQLAARHAPSIAGPPRRILLHSFLI
jgi:hypothetical protein